MRTATGKAILILAASSILAMPVLAMEVLIPRSVPGDKGKYYLLESRRKGDIVSAIHKRVGVEYVGYTQTETNCRTMLMREIGYSEVSPEAIRSNPTKWFELVPGSSKSDLAHFVCKLRIHQG